MAKKMMLLLLVFSCAVFAAWGAVYVKKSGILEPYPEPQYLTAAEEAQRPLYQQLSEKEKAVYTAIYRGICAHESEIALPYEVDGAVYSKLYRMIEKQEGELFYIDSTYYTAAKLRTAKIVYRDGTVSEHSYMENELELVSKKILSEIPAGSDDFDKALYIHDYIVENCIYEIDDGTGYGATAYGCLAEGSALCEGYAKAFSFLAQNAGLNSIVVTGVTDKGENHAWNQISIDGEWYNVDVTWDDDDGDAVNYYYFLRSDENFCESHDADDLYGAAFRSAAEDNIYYKRMGKYAERPEEAEEIVLRELKSGRETIGIKFINSDVYEEFKKKYITDGQEIFVILSNSGFETQKVQLTEIEEESYMELSFID